MARRASALRNGTGRARAVIRPGEVVILLLDQDAARWPWLLPGYRIDVVTIDELPGALRMDMPSTAEAMAALRAASDPDPARTASRQEAIGPIKTGAAKRPLRTSFTGPVLA